MNERITIRATLEAVSKFTQRLEEQLSAAPADARMQIVLALQELLVNIVKHAYAGTDGDIELDIVVANAEIRITVTDSAENAFHAPDEFTLPDALDLPESGMGMYIIQQSVDSLKYERLANGNRWRLVKKLGG